MREKRQCNEYILNTFSISNYREALCKENVIILQYECIYLLLI